MYLCTYVPMYLCTTSTPSDAWHMSLTADQIAPILVFVAAPLLAADLLAWGTIRACFGDGRFVAREDEGEEGEGRGEGGRTSMGEESVTWGQRREQRDIIDRERRRQDGRRQYGPLTSHDEMEIETVA